MAALREAVYNALEHRTYESNAPVRLLWFDDRIELQSPGGPFGVVTDVNYRTTCDYRNPTLAEAAKNLGYVNRFGRGSARIESALADNGNPPAAFESNDAQWSVTMYART
ncbi:MAG: ATP-binding protein [Solirubrobacteraceae bacterium]